MRSLFPKMLSATLRVVATVQAVLGLAFLIVPERSAALLGLTVAPGWTNWLLGMLAARSLAPRWRDGAVAAR